MFSLVYPPEPAPLTGRPLGPRDEILPVVEPSGLVTGMAPRSLCHGGGMLLHPVVNLHIIDRNERLFLQKRSAGKHTWPLCWDTTVGGHIGYGEQAEEALFREAREEIGLSDFNPIFLGAEVYQNQREKELALLFAAILSDVPGPLNSEVAQLRWWTFDEIRNAPKSSFTPSFLFEFDKISDKLLSLL